MEDESDYVIAYTDGSCYHRDGSGGWAFRAELGTRTLTRYGFASGTTVNAMELTAIINVLEFVTLTSRKLAIYTDSQYSKNALNLWLPKWAKQDWTSATGAPIANLALLMRAYELLEIHRDWRTVSFHWVKGHAGNPRNEYVDKLASAARTQRITNWTGGNH